MMRYRKHHYTSYSYYYSSNHLYKSPNTSYISEGCHQSDTRTWGGFCCSSATQLFKQSSCSTSTSSTPVKVHLRKKKEAAGNNIKASDYAKSGELNQACRCNGGLLARHKMSMTTMFLALSCAVSRQFVLPDVEQG